MNFLGKNIRHLRKKFSQTQSELADMMGKGQTTIGNWENGVSEPNVEELLLLSNYFGTPVDILLKVDLSLTNWEIGNAGKDDKKNSVIKEYDHQSAEMSVVKEPEDTNFTYILGRLDKMQQQIDLLSTKLKGK
ncbi:MAG: helix-turn-helix transcriptional regulator [Chitinophagaceae bacterium]|nr:helix-turn-helix transcriptional regulator [Chitinophagaceae bacterium]